MTNQMKMGVVSVTQSLQNKINIINRFNIIEKFSVD